MQTSTNTSVGMLPPQALNVEEAVLSQMLMEKRIAEEAMILLPYGDIFYLEKHRLIYEAIKSLSEKNDAIDLLTVTQELTSTGKLKEAGGALYVTQITMKANLSANLEQHCRILLEKFIRRVIITTSSQMVKTAYSEEKDVFETLNKAQQDLIRVQESLQTKRAVDGTELLKETIKIIGDARDKPNGITGVRSGLTDIDKTTAGWQNSDLIILAARPGMGKTAAALVFARNAVVEDKAPTLFFSIEMKRTQLMTRIISAESKISNSALRKGLLQEYEWASLHSKLGKINTELKDLWIDDKACTLSDIRSKAITMKAKHGIKLIIIDYLQIIVTDYKGSREQEIAHISSSLKRLAKDLDIPIIALSQLSRAVESRPDKRPILSDLRESGSIEQDADIVIFCYRPEYYKIEIDEAGNSVKNLIDFIFAKHRNGALPTITNGCDMKYSSIYDFQEHTEYFRPTQATYNPNKFSEQGKQEEEPWQNSSGT